MDLADIIPLVVGFLGFVTALVALRKGAVREKADAAQSIATAAVTLMEKYESRLDELEETVKEQAEQIKEQAEQIEVQECEIVKQAKKIRGLESWRFKFLRGVQLLCDQIRELGHEPVWEPDREV